ALGVGQYPPGSVSAGWTGGAGADGPRSAGERSGPAPGLDQANGLALPPPELEPELDELVSRSIFCTCAVAKRRSGPTASALISILDRLSPLSVSHSRYSNSPWRMTRSPFPIDSATF